MMTKHWIVYVCGYVASKWATKAEAETEERNLLLNGYTDVYVAPHPEPDDERPENGKTDGHVGIQSARAQTRGKFNVA
jgi:hypothetical protein